MTPTDSLCSCRTFQLPLWQQMKKEGLPIEGLCVAAGIPSSEKAKEIIDGLRESGIKHVSFKPGSSIVRFRNSLLTIVAICRIGRRYSTSHQHRRCQPRLPNHSAVDWRTSRRPSLLRRFPLADSRDVRFHPIEIQHHSRRWIRIRRRQGGGYVSLPLGSLERAIWRDANAVRWFLVCFESDGSQGSAHQ